MKLLKNPLTYIFILALLLRLYKLGIFPYGFHIDEVKVGWNALSILKTGMDDQLKNFPLYYNSFGDYRPTGIFYLTIPSLIIFGNNIFAVRFASALFGALTIYAIYYLALALSKNKKLAIISSLLIAISTWHIEVSRATSEVAISTFFALFSMS
jgi:4-amino-4-deoxy-L-arabinose transferase-like glycosyltransferase